MWPGMTYFEKNYSRCLMKVQMPKGESPSRRKIRAGTPSMIRLPCGVIEVMPAWTVVGGGGGGGSLGEVSLSVPQFLIDNLVFNIC